MDLRPARTDARVRGLCVIGAHRVDNLSVRILVAEDDSALRSVLERGLRERGYVVDAVADGDAALGYLRIYDYEVAILDWRMPQQSGLDVLREVRRRGSPLPILMLTARDSAGDRVTGLDEGADDYLVKPFDFGELLARLRALQRESPALQSPRLAIGSLEFDPASREVRIGSARPRLTGTELSILEILMRRSPAVVPASRSPCTCGTKRPTRSVRTPSTCTWPGCGPSWRSARSRSRRSGASVTGWCRHERRGREARCRPAHGARTRSGWPPWPR